MSIRALWMDSDGEGAVVYDGRAFRDLVEALYDPGVLTGLGARQRDAGANMTVTLEPGQAVVESSYAANMGRYVVTVDADEEDIAVGAAPVSGTRRDILGLQVQDDAAGGPTDVREAIPVIVEGDTSGDDPDLPASFEPLWRIRVPSGTVAITDSLLDDLRSPARLAHEVVDTEALAEGAVTSAKIADGTIVAADLASTLTGRIGCLLRRTTNQTLAATSSTTVTWPTEVEDDGFFSSGSTVTIPTGQSGLYAITATFDTNVTTLSNGRLILGGSIGTSFFFPVQGGESGAVGLILPLSAGDTVQLSLFNSGSAGSITGALLSVFKLASF